MAGIGFELRKLYTDKSAYGYTKAFTWTGIVTAGPFALMVVLLMGVQLLYGYFGVADFYRSLYNESMVYPFIFSHIIVSGCHMVITRYISDRFYVYDTKSLGSTVYGIIAVALAIGGLIGMAFFCWASLPFFLKVTTYIFYMGMICVLLLSSFVSALRNYTKIVNAYAAGVCVGIVSIFLLLYLDLYSSDNLVIWTMLGMDLVVAVIAGSLWWHIIQFFGVIRELDFYFIDYFSTKKTLFFINFFYTIGLYAHNIIIWFGPTGECLENTYYFQPNYDTSTFFAYISTLPVMLLFVISTEIHFYEKYRQYLGFITKKGNYVEIDFSRREMLQIMWIEIRNVFDFQLVAALCFIAIGNILLPKIGLANYGLDVYNILVLSAFCVAVFQAIMIFLLYLEDRVGALRTTAVFAGTSIVFNVICVFLGESTYGFGAFLASFLTMMYSLYRLNEYSKEIDYHIFCSQPVLNAPDKGFFVTLKNKIYKQEVRLNAKK